MVPQIMKEVISLNLARQKYVGNNSYNPLVSIRIPTLNRSDLLIERAIPSALGQTYRNIEVVIVGDHCTDDTEDKLEKVKSKRTVIFYNLEERNKYEKELLKDPEIRWFMGPVRATNKATELCHGEWIAHLDDDDFWTSDHIEVLLEFALRGNYEFVSGDYIAVKRGAQEVRSDGCQTWLYKKYVADIFKYDPNCWKKDWNRVSDIDVFERMKSAEVKMGHLNRVVAYVIPRPGEDTIGLDAYKKYGNTIY